MADSPFAASPGAQLHVTVGARDWSRDIKEWSLTDDITQLGDSLSFLIPNIEGENSNVIQMGAMVEAKESSPDVNNGQPVPTFKGRVVDLETGSDASGGSVIKVTCADLGWHLTHTAGKPFFVLEGLNVQRLLDAVIDPAWGITAVVDGNTASHSLKQGRAVAQREANPQQGAIYQKVMIDPGEMIHAVLTTYTQREHKFMTISPKGELVLFTPEQARPDISYFVRFHGSEDSRRGLNNVVGRPKRRQTIDGLYTTVTLIYQDVIKSQQPNTEDPLDAFHRYVLDTEETRASLPFPRRLVTTDAEVPLTVSPQRRAQWHWARERFNADVYEVTFPAHSQGGIFFVSDSIIGCDDTVNGVVENRYVRAVTRSQSAMGGTTATLVCHKRGLLQP